MTVLFILAIIACILFGAAATWMVLKVLLDSTKQWGAWRRFAEQSGLDYKYINVSRASDQSFPIQLDQFELFLPILGNENFLLSAQELMQGTYKGHGIRLMAAWAGIRGRRVSSFSFWGHTIGRDVGVIQILPKKNEAFEYNAKMVPGLRMVVSTEHFLVFMSQPNAGLATRLGEVIERLSGAEKAQNVFIVGTDIALYSPYRPDAGVWAELLMELAETMG